VGVQNTFSRLRALTGSADTLRGQLARSVAGLSGLQLVRMFLALATSVILARTLGVEGYGPYAYVLGLVTLLALPAHAGLPPLLVREVATYEQAGQRGLMRGVTRRAHQLALALGLLTGGVTATIVLTRAGGPSDRDAMIAVSATLIPLLALSRVREAILQGQRRVVASRFPEMVVRPVVFLLLVGGLFVAGRLEPLAALVAQLGATAVALGVLSVILARASRGPHPPPEYDDRRWRSALLPFSAIAGVSYLNTEVFVPLVGMLASDAEVAYFRVAMSLGLLVAVPLTVVESVIHPHVARLYSAREQARLLRMVSRAGLVALVLSLPVVLVLGPFGRSILHLMYGTDYTHAYPPLLVLVAGFAVVNLIGPSMQLLYATAFETDALWISLASLALIAGMSLLWIPSHGALGAAIAFAVAKVVRAAAFRWWAHRRLSGAAT
jgi:O-antigen/teichoic acid export membrane protein